MGVGFFPGGGRNGGISFYPIENKNTTFFAKNLTGKCQISKSRRGLLAPLSLLPAPIFTAAHIKNTPQPWQQATITLTSTVLPVCALLVQRTHAYAAILVRDFGDAISEAAYSGWNGPGSWTQDCLWRNKASARRVYCSWSNDYVYYTETSLSNNTNVKFGRSSGRMELTPESNARFVCHTKMGALCVPCKAWCLYLE